MKQLCVPTQMKPCAQWSLGLIRMYMYTSWSLSFSHKDQRLFRGNDTTLVFLCISTFNNQKLFKYISDLNMTTSFRLYDEQLLNCGNYLIFIWHDIHLHGFIYSVKCISSFRQMISFMMNMLDISESNQTFLWLKVTTYWKQAQWKWENHSKKWLILYNYT